MNDVPPHQRPTNMVFQSYAIFPHLNVFDNIAYGLRKRRLPQDRAAHARVDSHAGDGAAGRASARGAPTSCPAASASAWRWPARWCARPKLLLLDEPLGALDKRLREAMQMELRQLQQSVGITFVFVTHDQEEALSMSDRVAVMSARQDAAGGRAARAL